MGYDKLSYQHTYEQVAFGPWCETCGYKENTCACGVKKMSVVKSSEGVKHDQGKPDMSLMPSTAMEEIAAVWTFGQRKYAAFNWAKGFTWRRPAAAALRHIFAWLGGEDKDPESGLSHLAHAICCLSMIIHFQKTATGKDDRYGKSSD